MFLIFTMRKKAKEIFYVPMSKKTDISPAWVTFVKAHSSQSEWLGHYHFYDLCLD